MADQKKLIELIIRQSQEVKSLLREIAGFPKKEKIPVRMLQVLREKSLALAKNIEQFKIEPSDNKTLLDDLSGVAKNNPEDLVKSQIDELSLYQEFGFTKEDYQNLIAWLHVIANTGENGDFASAFREYINLLSNNDVEPEEGWEKLIPAATGLIGIAGDIAGFSVSGNILILYFSTASGVLSIAGAFKSVRRKLKKFFKRK